MKIAEILTALGDGARMKRDEIIAALGCIVTALRSISRSDDILYS